MFNDEQRKLVQNELELLASRLQELPDVNFDESLWSDIYCRAQGAPIHKRSNLPFNDYRHNGVGIEWKFLKRNDPANDLGKRLMHPSASRKIELNADWDAEDAKDKVLTQWGESLKEFKTAAGEIKWGIMLWKPDYTQFVYFEEVIDIPDPNCYTGRWITGRHRDKETCNLGIFEKDSDDKAFSVTLPKNGSKIQPYFTVPTDAEVFDITEFYRSAWFRLKG
jgi:hypothetical protein